MLGKHCASRTPHRAPRTARTARPAHRTAAILGCLALLALAGCRGKAPAAAAGESRQPVVDVVTARALWLPVTRVLRVSGSLMADEEAEVAAETGGRVIETPVERGARVADGAALLKVMPIEAQAALQEAEANVAQIEVRLGINGDQALDVERVAEVSNARAAKELAQAEFGRIKKLYDDRVVSGSEFDQRRTQVEVAERQYDAARNNARQLYRQLEGARARLVLARKAVADTTVRAPFTGLVVERKVSVGDYVTRGMKVVTVVRINPLRVELSVPEQFMSLIRAGQNLDLEVDAYPGRRFRGQVRYVSPSLRADQRALVVEAVVPNQDAALRPGLFATAAVQQSGTERALTVPSVAIRNLAGSLRVYIVKGDRVEERLVTPGQVIGQATEIVNGLAEGDEVAQTNVDRLVDGGRVRVTAAGGAQPSTSTASQPRSR